MLHLNFLEICGLACILYFLVYKLIKLLLVYLYNNVFSSASENVFKPGGNFYAIVTGSTDGIGLEYARQLAEKGYSLLLISRSEEKLKQVAVELTQKYPQCKNIEYLAVDFTNQQIYDKIASKLVSLDGPIHVLVNNVGMGYRTAEYFANYPDPQFLLKMININIVSTTLMTELVLKIMLKQKIPFETASRGVVINISSGLGCSEFPMFSVYSSTKAYINRLSKILSIEYEKSGIIIQTVTPGQVDTKAIEESRGPFFVVSPKDFVRYALRTVGTEQQTNAHLKHKFAIGIAFALGNLIGEALFMKAKWLMAKMVRKDWDAKFNKFK